LPRHGAEERAAGHLDVEPFIDEQRAVRGAPVGGVEPLESVLAAEDRVLHLTVSARVRPVDFVVRTHHGRDTRVGRKGERSDVDLAQGLRIDLHVVGPVVADEVFDLRHDALALRALDLSRGDLARQVRIFPEGVVGAAEGEVAHDVDEGFEHHVLPESPGVLGDDHAVLLRVVAAPRGCKTHGRGHPRGPDAHRDSRRPVREPQRGYAQAGQAGPCAGLAHSAR
jgi:hypothetical protein